MGTLTIDFRTGRDPGLRLKGLSFEKFGFLDSRVYRDDTFVGTYRIESDFSLNSRTAKIEVDFLVEVLAELYENLPFDRIKYEGHYSLHAPTPEELLEKIKQKAKD